MKKILCLLAIFYSMGLNANYYKGNNGEYYYFLEACVKHKENNKEVLLSLPNGLIKYGAMDFQHLNSIIEDSLCSFYFEGNEKLINIENPDFSGEEDKFYFYKKSFNNDEKIIDILVAYDKNSYTLKQVDERLKDDLDDLNKHLLSSGISNIEVKSFEIFPVGDSSQENLPLEDRDNTQCFNEEFRDINDGYGRHKETLNKMLEIGADALVYYRKEKECYNAEKGEYVLNSGLANISGYGSNRRLRDSELNFKTALVAMEESKASKYTFSHELGHIFGLQHDIRTNPNDEGFFPFARGYGETDGGLISEYLDPNDQFYTIMGYAGSYDVNITTEGDERVNQSSPYFSTPSISLCGMERDRQCGKGKYHSTRSNAVSTLKITLPLIADIRSLTGKTLRKATNGDDEITGTPENDDIDVKSGNDAVYKSSGEDIINFTLGNNLFIFNKNIGLSKIVGFKESDKILLDSVDDFRKSKSGNNMILDYNNSIVVVENFYENFKNYKIRIENGKKYLIPVNFDPQADNNLHLDNETICIDYLSQDLTVTGTGTLCLEGYVSNLNVSFENGNVLLKGNNQLNNVIAKRTVLKPKSSNSGFYTYLPYQVSGDLILEDPNDSSVYSILNSTIRGNLEIKQGAYLTTLDNNENRNHELKIYGKIINNGDFNTFGKIKNLYDAAPLNLYLYDRFLDSETAVNTSFGSGSKGLDRIKGNIYVKSKYPFRNKNYEDVYSLYSLETFKDDNLIEVNSNQVIDSYKKTETKFQVNSGNRLIINNYDVGSFNLTKGSQLIINNFDGDADNINIEGIGSVAFNGLENENNNDFTLENQSIYGSEYPDIIVADNSGNKVVAGSDHDMVYSKGIDDINLGKGNDFFYNSIVKQGILNVYENEGTETIYTCALSTEKLLSNCRYDFNEYVTQKIIIHYNRDESVENYYKENDDLILEIGTKNKFVFKDAFLEDRIQYNIAYQDGSSIDWDQLKTLADVPEENRNVLKDGDYFEIFDESDNGTYYVPEGAMVTFGEYRSGEIVNNGSIKINNLNRNLEASGSGLIEVTGGNSSFLRFNNGDVNVSGYFYTREITAKNINYDFIKNDSIFTSSKIAEKIYGSVVLNNVENHNYYLGYRNYIYGSFDLKKDANLMSQRYGSYTTRRSSNLYVYGASYFKGNIYENEVVNGSKRSMLNINLSDNYNASNEIIEHFYLYDETGVDSITGVLSLNVFDLNAVESEVIKKFNSITHPINGNNIIINKDILLEEYKNSNTLFNVVNNSVLKINNYYYGKFNIESGSEVSIDKVLRNLNASGDGILGIEYINYRGGVVFPNGKVIFKGHNTSKSNIKAKTIVFDYVKKTEGQNYQYIYGVLEGNVVVRNSLGDSDYRVFGELTIRGSLIIEENVLITTNKRSGSSSQTMKVYGKFINNGEFNNIDKIGGIGRRELVATFYDYVVDGELVQKAYFNDSAFDKIKGNLSIYSTNIYDYNLSDLGIFNYFENGTNEIVIDKDLTLANYGGSLTNFNVKNGATLTIKSYVRGKFIVEEGAKLVVEAFGPYAGTLDVSGSGVLEVKNMGYRESVSFPNGEVILGADVRRASVKAKTIIIDYVHKIEERNYQSIYGDFEGNVIIRNSLNDSDYRVFNESTVRGSLTIEENVLMTTNKRSGSSSQTMKIYGKFVNNGEFNNIDLIGGERRRELVVTFYDYVVDGELLQKAYFNDGSFDKIKGNLSIYSTNIYDYNLSDLDIFNYFENGTNEIVIDKDLTLSHYGGSLTTFNVKSGATLTIKSYVRGKFIVEDGAKLVVEGFGSYSSTLDVSGSGVLEVKNMGYRESVVFPNGKVILGGDVRRANVKAETIVIDYIHKIDGRNYQSIYGDFEGDVIIRNSLNDSDYRVFNESTVRGSLTIEENVLMTTNETSTYYNSQTMRVYGKFVNNGEFNNIDSIGGEGRRELVVTFYDYVVDGGLVQKAYFNDGAFDKIKGNLSIYSTNIYDYNLSDLEIFNYFENGTNEIIIDKDLTLANYSGGLTTFNVKGGTTLTIKSYVRGKFVVEEGAKLFVEGFGPYASTLDVSGSGVLEVKNMGYRERVNFPSGKVILGSDVRKANVKAKTIIIDYIHKIDGRNYQSIYGDFEGNVIIRNSLNDSDYRVFNESTVKGSLTIEDNVLMTTNETSTYYNSQTMKIYGKFVNNGEFNNIDLIGGESRRELVATFYDYVVNGELIQKAYFNNGAFDKIKGSLSIYSTNIYDYDLSDISILKRFENNGEPLVINQDYTLGSYSGYNQSIVVKSGATLRIKSYVAGDFNIESGAKVIIDSFGPYARDPNISGNGTIEIKNSQGLDNINFANGTILFSGYNAGSRYSVTAKNIEFNKLYNDQDFQYIRSRVLNGNVIVKNSQFHDYVYFGYQNFKVNGVLNIENDVLFSIGRSDYQNLEVNGLLNNNGLITDKILVRGDYSGRITIKLNDYPEKGINANLNELGNYDISGDVWLNGTKIED